MDVPGLRRHALDEIRRFEEQARCVRRAERGRAVRAVRAVRRPRRGGVVDALGQSERMGAAPAAGGAASRGVGRREVLRHAGPDLAGSGSLHRSRWSCSISAWPSASPASTRCRSAGTSTSWKSSRTSTARFAIIAARPSRAVAALARTGGSAQSAAFATCPGGSSARRRCRSSPITFTAYYASLARAAAPVHAELAKVGLEDFSPPPAVVPVRGPDAETAAGARRTERRAQRRGAGQPDDGHAARARSVPVRQRDGQPGVPRRRCSG